jgi:ABC-type polar amino acid transport system ATPase subunit
MKLLEMNHVQKTFDDLEVIKDISLSVEKGEVVSVIGPSGSGKSTCFVVQLCLRRWSPVTLSMKADMLLAM